MVSDGSIRKLNKVIRTKKILEHIYDYCRTVKIKKEVKKEVEAVYEDTQFEEVKEPIPEEPIVEDSPVTPKDYVEIKPKPSSKKVIKSISTKIMKKRTLPKKVPIDEPVETEE